uniref:Uncharacterized protein n=1 Tax=viral metagenome TaxID=1070528 RepID=A0A6M3K4E3_9ZZZZ
MNVSDFSTYVKYDLKRTDKDTEIIQARNDAIMQIATMMPHGAYKYQSYAQTVLAQEDYPLPSTLIHLIKPLRLLDGSASSDSGTRLEDISKAEYDSREPNPNRTSPSTGRPSAACIYSNSVLLTPIPDKATYLIEINWTIRPTALSGASDLPTLGSEWDEVQKWMTLDRVFAGMGMFEESMFWRGRYETGQGDPLGMFKRLLDIERDKEGRTIGQVRNNSL